MSRGYKASGVNAFHLDDMVWDRVTDLLVNPDLIKQQVENWNKKHTDSTNNIVDFSFRFTCKLPNPKETRMLLRQKGEGKVHHL